MYTRRNSGFVANGLDRARKAAEPFIRAEVEKEYAPRIENSSLADRWLLQQEMERVIATRIRQFAPPNALY